MNVRLTRAQKHALVLLARPGAEASGGRIDRWNVIAEGQEVGTIHSESLLYLRVAGYVSWSRLDPLTIVQRITEYGRERVAALP